MAHDEEEGGYNDDRNSPIPLESPPIVGYSLSVSLGNRVWALPYSWREGQDRRLTKTFQGREKFLSVTEVGLRNIWDTATLRENVKSEEHNIILQMPVSSGLCFFFFFPLLDCPKDDHQRQSKVTSQQGGRTVSTAQTGNRIFDWVRVCVWDCTVCTSACVDEHAPLLHEEELMCVNKSDSRKEAAQIFSTTWGYKNQRHPPQEAAGQRTEPLLPCDRLGQVAPRL